MIHPAKIAFAIFGIAATSCTAADTQNATSTTSPLPVPSTSITGTSQAPETSLPGLDSIDTSELIAFVETARTQEFGGPPSIRLIPADEEPDFELPEQLGTLDWHFVQILGFTADLDRDEFHQFLDQDYYDGGFGFCCPIVASEEDDPDRTAAIVVHELVHLIDGTPTSFGGTMEKRAIDLALAEGNAVRVEEQFLESIGRTLHEIRPEYGELPDHIPPGLMALISAPYTEGYHLALAIAEAGGELAIDAAFENPPNSAEQVIFPDKFLAREEPTIVDRPPTPEGMNFLRSGTIGALVLKLMVEPHLGTDRSLDLVRNWAGDAYALANSDERVCLVANIVMDTTAAATDLSDALNEAISSPVATADAEAILFEHCRPAAG